MRLEKGTPCRYCQWDVPDASKRSHETSCYHNPANRACVICVRKPCSWAQIFKAFPGHCPKWKGTK